ncbi:MAG: hypothetical protein OXM61_07845 [Candidatus Poribacteria bacterium]|nr:hypothetical protein [Candidatus Poribacteria bacterium]
MTPEQWQQEFRKELDRLREPIERLCSLITLRPNHFSWGTPYDTTSLIREVFANLANETDENKSYFSVDIALLEELYHVLKLLPKPEAHLNYLKKNYEISEIHKVALRQILGECNDLEDYGYPHDMEADEKDRVLENIAHLCQHWQELLHALENEINCKQEIKCLMDQMPSGSNKIDREKQLSYMCKPVCSLLNKHPWNQKARELLEDVEGIFCSKEELHILTLINWGLNNKGQKMENIRRELQNRCGMYEIEWKPAELKSWTPIQAMFYITSETDARPYNDLPDLMEAGTPLEGAIALIYHLIDLMEYRHEI